MSEGCPRPRTSGAYLEEQSQLVDYKRTTWFNRDSGREVSVIRDRVIPAREFVLCYAPR